MQFGISGNCFKFPSFSVTYLFLSLIGQVTPLSFFNDLNLIFFQRGVPFSEQRRMTGQLVDIADVSNSLRAIEIAVGFLNLTGGDPNQLYKDYLANVLVMDVDVYSPSGLVRTNLYPQPDYIMAIDVT